MCLCDKKVLDESLLICNLMIFMYVVTALFTVDNGSSTTVVVQVTVPPGYTVKTSSRGDDPLVERTPSPAPAEQLSTDIIHTVQETPSPLVEQHCINATPSVSATNKKRKRKQLVSIHS